MAMATGECANGNGGTVRVGKVVVVERKTKTGRATKRCHGIEGISSAHRIRYSLDPLNCLIDHTTASRSGRYVTVPMEDLNEGESTSEGTC